MDIRNHILILIPDTIHFPIISAEQVVSRIKIVFKKRSSVKIGGQDAA